MSRTQLINRAVQTTLAMAFNKAGMAAFAEVARAFPGTQMMHPDYHESLPKYCNWLIGSAVAQLAENDPRRVALLQIEEHIATACFDAAEQSPDAAIDLELELQRAENVMQRIQFAAKQTELTHKAIYDTAHSLIWGYGKSSEEAWADARQTFLNDGFNENAEVGCEAIDCTKSLADSGLGGRGDFVLIRNAHEEVTGACMPGELGLPRR